MKVTTYGQKGGEGPNTGKRRVNYEVVLPDGTRLTKSSFTRDVPELWAIVTNSRGRHMVTLWDDPGIGAGIGAGTVPRGMDFQTIRATRMGA